MNIFGAEFWFVLAALGTWRITHLIAEEDGPADLVLKLRSRLGLSLLGTLMDCFQCVSLWIAVPFVFLVTRAPLAWVPVWLALSGAACLLERMGTGHATSQMDPPRFSEDNDHVVLRPRQDGPEG